jgi:integral membrane sensor domain MASE1
MVNIPVKILRSGMFSWLLFTVFYFLLSMVSLETRDPWSLSSVVWLPAGLLLGALCSSPGKLWPQWLITAAAVHVAVSLLYGRPWDIALLFMLLDLLIISPLALIWRNLQNTPYRSAYYSNILLLLVSIYLGSLVGGLLSYQALATLDYPVTFSHFFSWSISNAVGCLAIAPLFIIRQSTQGYRPNALSLLALIVASCLLLVLFSRQASDFHNPLWASICIYLTLAGSVMLSLFWQQAILVVYFIIISFIISLATIYGYGPFAADYIYGLQGVIASQVLLLIILTQGLLISSVVNKYQASHRLMQQQYQLVSRLPGVQHTTFFLLPADSEDFIWLTSRLEVLGIPVKLLATPVLLKAHIHPEDRLLFDEHWQIIQDQRAFSLRLLQPQQGYLTVQLSLTRTAQQEILGVIACNSMG